MIDFDGMAFQIAALEIRQSIGKKDTKLCKTKCAAKLAQSTETSTATTAINLKVDPIRNPTRHFSRPGTTLMSKSTKEPIVIMWNNEWRAGITTIDLLERGFPYVPLTVENKCPFKCQYTADRSLEDDSSMLVFHLNLICPIDRWPKKRRHTQNYVMFTVESPVHSVVHYDRSIMTDTFFNSTVTYRQDSTVFMPYDSLVKIKPETAIEDRWTEEEVRQIVKNKKKLAFQAVSNCNAPSGRDFLTKALQGMLNLDLYGGCGGRSCDTNCYNSEMDNHLFYFAFENSVCHQYITEKFWNSLRKLTVPVVLNRTVLAGIEVPHNAFIAADDFGSVEELAQYLISAQNDTERHLKHFEWTKTYRKSPYSYTISPLCSLCKMLHEKENRSIIDLKKFWAVEDCNKDFVQKYLL
uniref:Fucosyltransferase n=1 Tax=Globodera pallida TaxID=36090 RepID=A0A183BXF5_GLOPA